MNKVKRVFRWWTGWNPEIIENWLENMESQGWHVSRIQDGIACIPEEDGVDGIFGKCPIQELDRKCIPTLIHLSNGING